MVGRVPGIEGGEGGGSRVAQHGERAVHVEAGHVAVHQKEYQKQRKRDWPDEGTLMDTRFLENQSFSFSRMSRWVSANSMWSSGPHVVSLVSGGGAWEQVRDPQRCGMSWR